MKKSVFRVVVLIFITGIFLTTSCKLDKFDLDNLSTQTQLNHDLTAPLIKGSLNMGNLMESIDSTNLLNEDSEGLYYFAYKDSLLSETADDEVDIPDQNFIEIFIQSEYNIPGTFVDQYTIEETKQYPFEMINNARLDSVKTDAFTMEQNIHYTFRNRCRLIVTYLGLTKNGVPFKDTVNVNTTSGNFDSTITQTLYDYTTKMDNPDTSENSYFTIHYEFTLYDDGNAIEDDDELSVTSGIQNVDLKSAFGYLGQDTLMVEESTISLDFFSNSIIEDIEFADPEILFYIKNSYGVPTDIALRDIKGYPAETMSDTAYLSFTNNQNPFSINYPEFSEIGETKEDTIKVNRNNSNLSEFLANNPENISFRSYAYSNPDGQTNDVYNFVLDRSSYNVNYEVILPLWLKTNGLEMKDTMDLDLADALGEMDMIKEIIATLEVNNGLPIDLDIQMYFLDNNYSMIDSLFTGNEEYTIQGASVDNNGEVISLNTSKPEVVLEEDKVDRLKDVKKAILSARLRTSDFQNDQKVKFYSHYNLSFKMYMDATTDID